jgi:hypothetical protein
MKYIYITADTNDGDYIYQLSQITEEQLEEIQPVIDAVKANNGDFSCRDMGDSGERLYGDLPGYDEFYDHVPRGQYGIHTIESIEVFTVSDVKTLM